MNIISQMLVLYLNAIWYLRLSQVNMVVADVLVPIRHQDICNHH